MKKATMDTREQAVLAAEKATRSTTASKRRRAAEIRKALKALKLKRAADGQVRVYTLTERLFAWKPSKVNAGTEKGSPSMTLEAEVNHMCRLLDCFAVSAADAGVWGLGATARWLLYRDEYTRFIDTLWSGRLAHDMLAAALEAACKADALIQAGHIKAKVYGGFVQCTRINDAWQCTAVCTLQGSRKAGGAEVREVSKSARERHERSAARVLHTIATQGIRVAVLKRAVLNAMRAERDTLLQEGLTEIVKNVRGSGEIEYHGNTPEQALRKVIFDETVRDGLAMYTPKQAAKVLARAYGYPVEITGNTKRSIDTVIDAYIQAQEAKQTHGLTAWLLDRDKQYNDILAQRVEQERHMRQYNRQVAK